MIQALAGLSAPAIRRLRAAIEEKKKRGKKRSIFSTLNRKDSSKRSTATFVVNPNHLDENGVGRDAAAAGSTCLISKEQLKLMERLGEGSFAIVKRAIWTQASCIIIILCQYEMIEWFLIVKLLQVIFFCYSTSC